jgi:peptide deformylase
MAIREIHTYPSPVLKDAAKPVTEIDGVIAGLVDDMAETMYAAPGIGLAAPQVGVLKRVIVLDVAREGEEPQPLRLANPEVVWVSDEDVTYNEGCLSVPEHYADVARPKACRVTYIDHENKPQEIAAEGLLATCLQHEIDHLDGVLFIDHLTSLKRNIILRKLLKAKKAAADAAM